MGGVVGGFVRVVCVWWNIVVISNSELYFDAAFNISEDSLYDLILYIFNQPVHIQHHSQQDIDIKNQGQTTCYAFIQFDNIRSVVSALRELDDEPINNVKIKVGVVFYLVTL